MNRSLLLPFLASVSLFVVIAMASRESPTGIEAGAGPDQQWMSSEEISKMLTERWVELGGSANAFSRVYRPGRQGQQIEILVDAECKPPAGTFAGTLRVVQELDGALVPIGLSGTATPIIADRVTGKTLVFEGDKWQEFDSWAVASRL